MRRDSEPLDETPPGGTPTPGEDVVDAIGAEIGLTYHDDEELRAGDKERARDEHRWELDPASADDYVERVHEQPEAEPVRHFRHEHQEKKG